MKVGDIIGKRINASGNEVNIFYSYKDVKYDNNGWADASVDFPANYDLVYMKIKDKNSIAGWISINQWMGLRLKPSDKVIGWKRKPEDEDER